MEYTAKSGELKNLFSLDRQEICIPGSGIKILNIAFRSGGDIDDLLNMNDRSVEENHSFTYPVFVPENRESKRVILLFHGLNERSWQKYLTWAFYLAGQTGSYVVLFPIAFHMNRSPSSWKDPHVMMPAVNARCASGNRPEMSSFANVALSNRLTEDPMRFFFSGYRTVLDISGLARTIRDGTHPVIPPGSRINIFAYSIGAFMAQIIMMGNPGGLFSDSKLFMFCGGSVFSSMKGTSRLIMDSRAFDRIYSYYLDDFENTITAKNPLFDFFSSRLGMSFRAMIGSRRHRLFRETRLKSLEDQMQAITLAGDKVIPCRGVTATLNRQAGKKVAEVWDFRYPYSHENPFPILNNDTPGNVNSCFERVFARVSEYLA